MNRLSSALIAGFLLAGVSADAALAQIKVERNARGELVLSNDPSPRVRRAVVRPRKPNAALQSLIERYSLQQNLDVALVRAVIQAESSFDPRALSPKGAMGLMQLMPSTARELGVSDPWDPEQNVRGGTRYLRRMLDQFDGQVDLALAGYNAGPGAVQRYGGVPPYRETVGYIDRVLRLMDGSGWKGRVGSSRPPRARQSRPVQVRRDGNNQILLVTN
ncbi:MAG: lytic transglycosylase domain-containing protein [Acidobacteriota bacterium]